MIVNALSRHRSHGKPSLSYRGKAIPARGWIGARRADQRCDFSSDGLLRETHDTEVLHTDVATVSGRVPVQRNSVALAASSGEHNVNHIRGFRWNDTDVEQQRVSGGRVLGTGTDRSGVWVFVAVNSRPIERCQCAVHLRLRCCDCRTAGNQGINQASCRHELRH